MYKTMNVKTLIIVLFSFLSVADLAAQSTQIFQQPDDRFSTAKQLYDKGHYGAAQKMFEDFANNPGNEYSVYKDDALYYSSMCALKLFNKDAEYLINSLSGSTPKATM